MARLTTTTIATDKCELQAEMDTTNLQYTAFRDKMTLAIEHKSEENSISSCFTNTLRAARTCVKFLMLGKFSKNGSLLGETGVIRGGRYNFFALLGKCLMSVCTYYGFSRAYF